MYPPHSELLLKTCPSHDSTVVLQHSDILFFILFLFLIFLHKEEAVLFIKRVLKQRMGFVVYTERNEFMKTSCFLFVIFLPFFFFLLMPKPLLELWTSQKDKRCRIGDIITLSLQYIYCGGNSGIDTISPALRHSTSLVGINTSNR